MSTENVFEMDEDSINLVDLFHALLRKWWVLVISAIIGAIIAGAVTVGFMTPQYKAKAMIYIYNKTTSVTSLADLQIGSQLAVDFQIVATTREVVDAVISKLELDTTYEQMVKWVSITNPQGSHILSIETTNPDPALAARISNTLADELRTRIADVMNTDEPSVVERAVVPAKPSSPSLPRNVLLGGGGCFTAAAAIICATFLMDDTIKTSDDVKRYLHLNTLAEIPKRREAKGKS